MIAYHAAIAAESADNSVAPFCTVCKNLFLGSIFTSMYRDLCANHKCTKVNCQDDYKTRERTKEEGETGGTRRRRGFGEGSEEGRGRRGETGGVLKYT